MDHYVVTTKSIKKAVEFYKILGFQHILENGNTALLGNGFKIKLHELITNANPLPDNVQIGGIDICFEVDEILDEIMSYLKDNGIKIKVGKVKRIGYKGAMTSVYINDPDGNLIELSSYE